MSANSVHTETTFRIPYRFTHLLLSSICAMISILACAVPATAQSWELQYFFDDVDERFYITDLAFPSAERGIAVGVIVDDSAGRVRDGLALVTSDGGATWDQVELDQQPVSLFFLDDSIGWLVTDRGIWKTLESGRSWRRISRHGRGSIRQVWFLTEQRGFAIGEERTVLETSDGGENWTPVAIPGMEEAFDDIDPDSITFTHIAFSGNRGMIVGSDEDARGDDGDLPVWLFPELYSLGRPTSVLTVELRTLDAGESWSESAARLPGVVEAVSLQGPDSLVLFGFPKASRFPSEVHYVVAQPGTRQQDDDEAANSRALGTRAFGEENRLITDLALFENTDGSRTAFLAGVEPPGDVPTVPVAGKLRMYRMGDLPRPEGQELEEIEWEELEVDYRAVARSVILAGPNPDTQWAATDTGMILRLVLP